jgi:hypothetical protein
VSRGGNWHDSEQRLAVGVYSTMSEIQKAM